VSEGPEVRRTADRIAEVLVGRTIEAVEFRKRRSGLEEEEDLSARVVGTRVKDVRTHGKNIVIVFTRELYLHNHMMMWGKWRTYARRAYDAGLAKPPPRVRWRRARNPDAPVVPDVEDVRKDSRVRLVLATAEHVAVQFNGPILRFSRSDPAKAGSIERLGPDALAGKLPLRTVEKALETRGGKTLADLLLDQSFVAGIGNKYKSDILFLMGLYPFRRASSLDASERKRLFAEIPRMLRFGYQNGGRSRPLEDGESARSWDTRHWVFRRGGRPCWNCSAPIRTDRTSSARVTYWCPRCQPEPEAGQEPAPLQVVTALPETPRVARETTRASRPRRRSTEPVAPADRRRTTARTHG
jgi:endonuclease-8